MPAEDDKIVYGITELITLGYALYQPWGPKVHSQNPFVRMNIRQLLTSKVGPAMKGLGIDCFIVDWFADHVYGLDTVVNS